MLCSCCGPGEATGAPCLVCCGAHRDVDLVETLQRVKLDPLHFLKRYTDTVPKGHPLFGVFANCLRDALFINDDSEVDAWRDFFVARGMRQSDAESLGAANFIGHVRRTIPVPSELAIRLEAVFQFFVGLEFPSDVGPLIADATRTVCLPAPDCIH